MDSSDCFRRTVPTCDDYAPCSDRAGCVLTETPMKMLPDQLRFFHPHRRKGDCYRCQEFFCYIALRNEFRWKVQTKRRPRPQLVFSWRRTCNAPLASASTPVATLGLSCRFQLWSPLWASRVGSRSSGHSGPLLSVSTPFATWILVIVKVTWILVSLCKKQCVDCVTTGSGSLHRSLETVQTSFRVHN